MINFKGTQLSCCLIIGTPGAYLVEFLVGLFRRRKKLIFKHKLKYFYRKFF